MQIDRRAYYNALFMSWNDDHDISAEPWQVEDYRTLSLEVLFDRLEKLGITLDKASFLTLVDDSETPEDLTNELLEDSDFSPEEEDQTYLLLFELWRKLAPEKQGLSLFCDELDRQIYYYDRNLTKDPEALEDAIANLLVILVENTDLGAEPREVFHYIKERCASDVESFLYEYIAVQIDNNNDSYATDLLDNLGNYVHNPKWFTFLKIRLLAISDPPAAQLFIRQMVCNAPSDPDSDFNFEILSFLIQGGERDVFVDLLKQTIPLLKTEEEFQDLLTICSDYFHCLDLDQTEKKIQYILNERQTRPLSTYIEKEDPHFSELLQIVK